MPPAHRALVLIPGVEGHSRSLGVLKNDDKDFGAGSSEYVALAITRVVAAAFEDKGFEVLKSSDMTGDSADNPAASAARQIEAQYEGVIKEHEPVGLQADPAFAGKLARYLVQRDLIDQALVHDTADLLVLTYARGEIVETSHAAKAMEGLAAIAGGGPVSDMDIHIAVVDARTGRLLYYGETPADGDFLKNPDKVMTKPIGFALRPFFSRLAKPK